jgi:DNA-binding transcriptional ArsR family regulator
MPMDTERRGVELAPAVALFRSLADPTRLAIIQLLAAGEARVVDLTQALGCPQSTVSGHLACLRDCGLVSMRPVGRASIYALACPALLDLLATAEGVLDTTGNAPAHCPECATTAALDPPRLHDVTSRYVAV